MKHFTIILTCGLLLSGCSDNSNSSDNSSAIEIETAEETTAEITEPVSEPVKVNGLTVLMNGNSMDIMNGGIHVQTIELAEEIYPPEYKDINSDGYEDIFIRSGFSDTMNAGMYYIYDSDEGKFVFSDALSNLWLLSPEGDPVNAEMLGVKAGEMFKYDGYSYAEIFEWEGPRLIRSGRILRDTETGELTQLYRRGTYNVTGEIVPAEGLNETDGLSIIFAPEAVYIKDASAENTFVTIEGDFSAGKCITIRDYNFDMNDDFAIEMQDENGLTRDAVYFLYDPETRTFRESGELNSIGARLSADPLKKTLSNWVMTPSADSIYGYVDIFTWDEGKLKHKEQGRIQYMSVEETGYDVIFTDSGTGEVLRTEHYDELPLEYEFTVQEW